MGEAIELQQKLSEAFAKWHWKALLSEGAQAVIETACEVYEREQHEDEPKK